MVFYIVDVFLLLFLIYSLCKESLHDVDINLTSFPERGFSWEQDQGTRTITSCLKKIITHKVEVVVASVA